MVKGILKSVLLLSLSYGLLGPLALAVGKPGAKNETPGEAKLDQEVIKLNHVNDVLRNQEVCVPSEGARRPSKKEPRLLERLGCEGLCPESGSPETFIGVRTTDEEKTDFQKSLNTSPLPSGERVIQMIENIQPQLYELFKSTNRKSQKDTIEKHSIAVMNTFEEQFSFYDLKSVPVSKNIRNLEALCRVGLALHDIGKPVGGKKLKHQNTSIIMKDVLKQLGFNEDEMDLAMVLFNRDIGETGRTVNDHFQSTRATAQEIIQDADRLKIPSLDLLRMKMAFFVSDATYNPSLQKFFRSKTVDGFSYRTLPQTKIEPTIGSINALKTEIVTLDKSLSKHIDPKLQQCLDVYDTNESEKSDAHSALVRLIKAFAAEQYYKKSHQTKQFSEFHNENKTFLFKLIPIYDHHALALLDDGKFYELCKKQLSEKEILNHIQNMLDHKAKGALAIFNKNIAENPDCFAKNKDSNRTLSDNDEWDFSNPNFSDIAHADKKNGLFLIHMLRLRFMKEDWVAQKFDSPYLAPTGGRKEANAPSKLSFTLIETGGHIYPVAGSFMGLLAKPQSKGLIATGLVDLFTNKALSEDQIREEASNRNEDLLNKLDKEARVPLKLPPKDAVARYSVLAPSVVLKAIQGLKGIHKLDNSEIVYNQPVEALGYILFDLNSPEFKEALYASLADDLSGPAPSFLAGMKSLFKACNQFKKPILFMKQQ